jgi:hypothetical protein
MWRYKQADRIPSKSVYILYAFGWFLHWQHVALGSVQYTHSTVDTYVMVNLYSSLSCGQQTRVSSFSSSCLLNRKYLLLQLFIVFLTFFIHKVHINYTLLCILIHNSHTVFLICILIRNLHILICNLHIFSTCHIFLIHYYVLPELGTRFFYASRLRFRALGRSSSRWRFCALLWALNLVLLCSRFRAPVLLDFLALFSRS